VQQAARASRRHVRRGRARAPVRRPSRPLPRAHHSFAHTPATPFFATPFLPPAPAWRPRRLARSPCAGSSTCRSACATRTPPSRFGATCSAFKRFAARKPLPLKEAGQWEGRWGEWGAGGRGGRDAGGDMAECASAGGRASPPPPPHDLHTRVRHRGRAPTAAPSPHAPTLAPLLLFRRLSGYGLGVHLIQGTPVERPAAMDSRGDHLSFQVRGKKAGGMAAIGRACPRRVRAPFERAPFSGGAPAVKRMRRRRRGVGWGPTEARERARPARDRPSPRRAESSFFPFFALGR
jgi:hypothetical protein